MENQSRNGNQTGVHVVMSNQASHQSGQQPLSDNTQKESRSVILKMQKDLFKHGYERAQSSGALEPRAEDLTTLDAHAQAIAREAHRELFDPEQHTHDKLRHEQHEKDKRDLADAEVMEKHLSAAVADQEKKVARTPTATAPSELSLMLLLAAVIILMVPVAATLQTYVFVMDDQAVSWGTSIVIGMACGLFVTLMILHASDTSGRRTTWNWMGLSAGLLMCVALFAIRTNGGANTEHLGLAIGLTLFEVFIVLALEGVAMSRRRAYQEYASVNSLATQESRLLEAGKAEYQRAKERIGELKVAVVEHHEYVEDRALRFLRIDEIVESAVKAVTDGYYAGISFLRGRTLGVRNKEV